MLLMNCKGYRNSRSHCSLPRDEIGSIYLLQKNPKGVFTREHSGGHREKRVFADPIPKVISWSPAGFLMLKDKLRHITIFKSLFEQKSIQIRQHAIQQIGKISKELYKMKDL